MNYKEERPWGRFENLLELPTCKVKQLVVLPGQQLSLQSHVYRDEHWIVVQGTATVSCLPKYEDAILQYGSHIFIPRGSKHRLANFSNQDLVLVEVQVGESFLESDITRFSDIYNRDATET